MSTHRIDITFKNANANAVAVPQKQNAYFENYIAPHIEGGFTTANAFEQITITNLYNGIDWVIYQKNGKLKYDLIVHPNGNVQDIAMEITDADHVQLINNQHLQINTKLGNINDTELYCYEKETGTNIPANFNLAENEIAFTVGNYNKNTTLIIDPEIGWSTFYGGDGEDAVNGMAVDGNGDIVITGYTHSDNNMAYLGYVNTYLGGTFDAYVAKLDANGNRLWGTYFGGTKGDFGTEVVTNNHNDIFVTGFTYSSNFETTPGVHQEELGNNYDAFLIKLNSSGGLLWSTLFGGGNYDYARGIALDTVGNVYISGSTSSTLAIAFGGWQNTKGGANDEFLAKFNNEGTLLWATYMGGELDDFSRAVAVDGDNNVYIVGYTESTTGIAYNAFDSTWADNYDCTLTKYTADGILLWSTYFGGNGDDNGNGIDFDAMNNVYVAVQSSTSNGLCDGGYRSTTGGGVDALLVKFNPEGDRVWSTYYGGSGEDMAKAVCVVDEFVYIGGHTASASGIAEYAYQETLGGARDGLLVKFDVHGDFYWGSYAGGINDEFGRTLCVLTNDAIIFGGKSFSSNFPVSVGAHQSVYGGNPADGFIQRINDCASALVYFEDADGDLFGDVNSTILSCSPIAGYVLDNIDCDDADANIFPSNIEICNSIDDDCVYNMSLIDEEKHYYGLQQLLAFGPNQFSDLKAAVYYCKQKKVLVILHLNGKK
ncbi:MAG: SBBP repeat-containing protein [Bacteroidetes bacterium]|nr:SBBP repeat-containing protein [Bacteroidota bacterium]